MDTTKSLNDVVQLLLCQQIAAEGVKEEDLERLFKSFSSLPKHTPRYEPLQVITEKEKIISHKNEVPSSPERVAPLKPLIPSNNGINNGASTSKLDIISATSAAVQELEKQTWVPKEVGTYSPIQVFIDPPSLSSAAMSAQPSSSQTEPNDLSFIDLPEMNEQAVVSRICKLRSQGKWSLTRLPLCLEAPRQKVHHDYFLEEIQMMAVDFRQERDLKKKLAKMLAEEAADVVKAKQKENMQNEPPVESKKKRLKYFDLENKVISTLLENNWNEQVSSFEHAEEQQFVDSLNNPWYHGQIIEPDPFAYTDDLSPMEFMDDTQPLHDNSEAPDAAYFADSMGYSPKSSEDISGDDSRTVTSTVEQIEPTLDGFMVERTPPPQQRLEVVEPPLKKGTGQKKKHEDPSKRLYGNQVLVLADPNPLVKPDGKPGYTPTPYPAEWVEADVPPWTIIEDVCLLRTMVSQLKALPLPAYVARSFCVNWELITRAVRKVSFFHRTQFRCCLRFRELIGAQKKLAPTDNADLPSVTFDGLELPEVFDERVKGSTMPITRCFMRTITILLRKHAELRKTRLIWQKRMDLLHDTDEAKRYNLTKQILERPQPSAIQMNEGMRKYVTQRKISQILPSYSILKAVRNGNPTEPNVVYQHYTKKMRILRVLNTAHGFINRHFKDPTLYLPIQPFYGSLTLQDGIVISMKRDGWTESLYQKLLAQRRNLPMIENVLERRCILRKDPKERDVSKFTQEEIIRIRAQSQHSIDVRATTYPSQQNMTDALKLASSYSKPARRNDISLSRIGPRHGEVDANNVKLVLEEEVKTETINAIKQRRAKNKKPYLLLPNGIPILPLDRISTKTYPIREDPIVHPYPSSIKTAELLEKCGLGFCGLKASEEFVKKFANEMKRMQDERHNLVWPGIGRVFKEKGGTVKELDGGEEESEVVLKLSYIPSKSTKIPSNYVIRLKDNNITELHQLPNVSTLSDYSRIPIERKMKCFEKSYADSEAMEDDAIPTYESLYINNSLYDIQQDYLDSDDRKTLSITLNGRLEAVLQARRKGVKYNEKQFDYCIKLDTVKPGIKLDAVASAETLDTVINGEKLDTVTAGENLDTVPSCSNVVTVKPSIVKQRNLLQNLDWKKMMENKLDKAQRFRLVPVENGTKNEFWLIDRDGDQDEEGVTEIKLSVDDAASDGDKKLMLRRVEDRDKLFPQLDQIINENIQKVIGYFDEYRQKDGAIKEQSKDDDLKAVVLLEFDSVVANLPVIDLSNMRIKASFDEDEDEPRIIFSCQKNKKVINMKQDIVNGQVNFSIAVREDPFEDLNEKPSETLITKYETDNSVLPVLARPHIKSTIVKRLSKWSEKRRRRWLNVLKYRFLRRKTMRLNKTVRSTVRVVCDKRPSTSKNITSEANDRDEAGKQSTEFRKLAIRKRLASMRNKKGDNEHEAKSPVKLANELASSLPNSGVSTPMRSRLPTHHDESDQHLNTPVEKSPQPELFNTVSELLLATKLKTLDQDSDLYKPVFVEDSEIPESMVEVKNDKDLCAFRFDRQSDDLFVADNGIKDVLSGPTPIGKTSYQEDIENPLDVISLPTMGPSKILKMRAAQVPPRIQKKHERIRERLEKEAAEYKVAVPEDKPKEEEESQLPSADSLAPQRVYTYGNEPSNSQRVVMFRSGATPPVYSRPVHTNTAGGQVRTYVVHSQMNPPPQQHFTSAGQPVSIHQPAPSTSTHNQHYVYSQSNNDHNKFPQPSSISYRPMTIQKSRPKPARPGNPQIGRRIGRNDSVGTEGRELTVRETLQRLTMNKGAARAGPAPPGQRPSFYPKAQGQRAQIPRPERPTLKRRLEDPSSLQVELQPMESEKRRKIAPKEGTAQPKPADDQLKPSTSSTKKPNILPST